MEEKLFIENFGGLKSVEIDVGKINVFIGPQASGKSVIAKLLFFFKSFPSEILKSVLEERNKHELDRGHRQLFIRYFPEEAWPAGSFKIKYSLGGTWMMIKRNDGESVKFTYSEEFRDVRDEGRKIYEEEQKKLQKGSPIVFFGMEEDVSRRFYQYSARKISPLLNNNQFFVPAGRSFFAHIQTSIFSFLSSNKSLDPFLIEFGSYYEKFKLPSDFEEQKGKKNEALNGLVRLMNEIINGKYVREKNKDFIIHSDDRKVRLANASSGQQEILPLLLILKSLFNFRNDYRGITLYIEEPETHLFPSAQKKVVQLLARLFNNHPGGFQITVTTHSPYILSSFNTLLEAGKIIKDFPERKESVYRVVPKEEVIEPRHLMAYAIDSGSKKTLIDEETELIAQNTLDSVSDDMAIDFGKLLDIHYELEEGVL